ncbi:cytochrome b/b6 domain-containing protein [uncultured Roseobacter sp.]|uniref:cytochrome b/b6 domain-containing protein n=1 Tax=uncultured Roseobacter sp. TaxID=114847 RepID=UPI00260F3F30|nr:cytochrome b/b6 domain-containing protein [uncultured Roseobacter sp.]
MKIQRRTYLKWLHWRLVPLVIWFTVVQPHDIRPFGDAAFMFHSVLGLIFVTLALLWTADYLRRGLASRPGPKLSGPLRRFHRIMHLTLIWGLFGVAITGFLLGLTSTVLLWAGGIVPIAPPLGLPRANDLVGQIHSVEFYLLSFLVGCHALFHIWRHLHLRDNALRIMLPRLLHKYL